MEAAHNAYCFVLYRLSGRSGLRSSCHSIHTHFVSIEDCLKSFSESPLLVVILIAGFCSLMKTLPCKLFVENYPGYFLKLLAFCFYLAMRLNYLELRVLQLTSTKEFLDFNGSSPTCWTTKHSTFNLLTGSLQTWPHTAFLGYWNLSFLFFSN